VLFATPTHTHTHTTTQMRVDVYENECQVIWCFVAVKPETSKYFRFIRHFYVAQQCRRYGL